MVLFVYASHTFANERDVVNALESIQRDIEGGINFSTYTKLLNDAQGKVNLLKRKRKYNEYNEFILHVNTCLMFFQDAKLFWDWKKNGEPDCDESMNYCWGRAFFELAKARKYLK